MVKRDNYDTKAVARFSEILEELGVKTHLSHCVVLRDRQMRCDKDGPIFTANIIYATPGTFAESVAHLAESIREHRQHSTDESRVTLLFTFDGSTLTPSVDRHFRHDPNIENIDAGALVKFLTTKAKRGKKAELATEALEHVGTVYEALDRIIEAATNHAAGVVARRNIPKKKTR